MTHPSDHSPLTGAVIGFIAGTYKAISTTLTIVTCTYTDETNTSRTGLL